MQELDIPYAEADLDGAAAGDTLPALLDAPRSPTAVLTFAHGAGARMRHEFMQDLSDRLVAAGIATLRLEVRYMARGGGRPDNEATATAVVHPAIKAACSPLPGVPVFASGKSFGGRMTSTQLSKGPEPDVRGLVFFGFPLHPAGAPATKRGEHLKKVKASMLFLQGTRDALAELDLVTGVAEELGKRATLKIIDGADHGFAVLKRSGRTNEQVRGELVEHVVAFTRELAP